IDPGIYTEIKVSGSGRLILNPGIYVLAGGGLAVTGSGSINGDGVMLYNAGSNYTSGASNPSFGGLTLSSSGNLPPTPMTSGTYAGVLIFQARDNTRALSLSGNGTTLEGGVIYARNAMLALSGNTTVKCPLVVNQLQLTGNAASALAVEGLDSFANTAGQLL